MKRILALVCVGAFVLAGAACNNDKKSSDSKKEFCSLNNAVSTTPTADQLDQLVAAAPDEIADEVKLIVDEYKKDPAAAQASSDPKVTAAATTIGEYIDANCEPPPTTQGSAAPQSS